MQHGFAVCNHAILRGKHYPHSPVCRFLPIFKEVEKLYMNDKTPKTVLPKGGGGIVRKPASSTLSPEDIAMIKDSIRKYKPVLDELAKR